MPPANETDAGNAHSNGSESAKDGGKDAHDGGKNTQAGGKAAQEAAQAKPRSKKTLIILGVVVVVGAIVAFFIWFAHRNQVSTDDAYTDGNVITMAPKVSGYVVDLFVDDNSRVRKGDLMLRIEPQDFRTAQAAAQSQLTLAKAQLKTAETALRIARVQFPAQLVSAEAQRQSAAAILAQAQASYARQHEVDRRATTQENIDTSTSQQLSSNANLRSAQAQVAIAGLVPEQIQQAMNAVAEKT